MGSRSAWFTQQVLGQPGYVVRPYLKTIYPNISFGDICHIYAYIYMYTHTHTYIYIYAYTYTYICMYMRVCVCVSKRIAKCKH